MSALSAVLVGLAVACLLLMAVLLSVAGRSRREVRSSIFPIVREESATRVRRARIGATVAAMTAAVVALGFFASDQTPLPALRLALPDLPHLMPELPVLVQVVPTTTPLPEHTATPMSPESPTPTDAPARATPTATAVTPTATAMATTTAIPTRLPATATPAAAATREPATAVALKSTPTAAAGTPKASAMPTPRPSPVPLPADAALGPIAFSTAVGDDLMAVSATQIFSGPVSRVYAVFPFKGMRKGLLWTRVWYFNGMEFARDEDTWQWGAQARSFVFVKPVGAGEYRLDLLVNEELMTSGKFTLLGPAAIGGPQTP